MAETAIEWTERTWNPIVGCSVLSPGCKHCYAMIMARRLEAMGVPHYAGLTQQTKAGAVWTGKLALAPEHVLLEPLRRRKPTTYFVNSMGDLFHEDVPEEWIDQVFAVMALAPQHTFQVLTKRAERMRRYFSGIDNGDGSWLDGPEWRDALIEGSAQLLYSRLHGGENPSLWLAVHMPLPNVWLGVSAEDQKRADERIPELLATPAAIRFVSAEPLLGPIDFRSISPNGIQLIDALNGMSRTPDCDFRAKLDWIIAGGESGPGARPMHPDWPRQIRDQCATAGTAFFFKQWGEWLPDDLPSEMAEDLELRNRYATIGDQQFARAGKKAAGRLLDGVEHNAMPEARRG